MTNKVYGIIGLAAPIIFCLTYAIMSSLRPEYSMFTKAISELGSTNSANMWWWNFFGYILPGTLIAIYAIGLYKNIAGAHSSKLPLYGILLSGVLMALAGVFPGDFDNRQSTTMLLHSLGSIGSYLFFLIGAFTYPKLMHKTGYWKSAKKPTLTFTYLTILFGSWPFVFSSIPALGQRIVFLLYFLWLFYTAIMLYKMPKVRLVNHND